MLSLHFEDSSFPSLRIFFQIYLFVYYYLLFMLPGLLFSGICLFRVLSTPNCKKRNFQGFLGGSAIKNPPTNAGDIDIGSISWSGRSPGGRNGNLSWYSCLRSPMDREAGHYSPMGSQRVGHNLATKQQEQNSFLNAFLKSVCIRILYTQSH